MKLSIKYFLSLRFNHEFHEYHKEGGKCIYQDLIQQNKTIREILFCITSDPAYLNTEKYESSPLLSYDHMKHYIYCILYGFRVDVINWREPVSKNKLSDPAYYISREKMGGDEIDKFLSENEIAIDENDTVHDGFHRCFCMIGRIMRGERYIPVRARRTFMLSLRDVAHKFHRPGIKNVGYRIKDNAGRLRLICRNIKSSDFTLLDVGSNYGYFSASLAARYPNSIICSVEGSFGTGNEDMYNKNSKDDISGSDGIQTHVSLKNKHLLFNNHIFCMLMTKDVIASLLGSGFNFDYQLSLSVFHWIAYERFGNNGKPDELYRLLSDHLSCAGTTFIELPDIKQETSLSPMYGDCRTVSDVLKHIQKRLLPGMNFHELGSYKWYGTRYLYRIDMNKSGGNKFDKKDLIDICKPVSVY